MNPDKNLKFNRLATGTLTLVLCLTTACKNDGKGLQETLKGALLNPVNTAPTNNKTGSKGSSITPGKSEKLSAQNSISSCPDDARIIGRAFPQGSKQWCAYKADDKTEIMHGEYRKWHSSGDLQILAFYEDGELHGEFIEWYPGKILKEKTSYQNGKRHGKSLTFGKDGSKIKEITFVDDELNGEFAEYQKGGKLKAKGTYIADVKHGNWEEYDSRGNIKFKLQYHSDMKHGRVIEYTSNAKPKAQGFYDKDIPVGHWIYFNKMGAKQSEGNFIAGKKHGRWLEYNLQGQLVRTTYFDDGKKLDSVLARKNQNPEAIKGSFGSTDILGAEPPLRDFETRQHSVFNGRMDKNGATRRSKPEKPEPLKNEGWAPL